MAHSGLASDTNGSSNGSEPGPVPPDLDIHLADQILVAFLSVCFLAGGPLNILVFVRQTKRLLRKATRSLYLRIQLNISDLLVLFVFVPSQLIWQLTMDWRGGLMLCKLLKFCHELAFLISSAILACIGLDRLLSIVQPFVGAAVAKRRARIMTHIAWAYSLLFSCKNLFSWTLREVMKDHYQCVTWDWLGSDFLAQLQVYIYLVHAVTTF